ncbi:hypothetical protein Catovirus_1_693 [Catovirus CTV1]|uniref:Uncharacterized protein n=1 Tax=Catovirus CTV1 TaxID=1977631 RepID=A0A1V0SAC4_9VIRU|nr:hypothetical protein Catovirus_1_693 [Catovirus CTV1]
MSTQKHNKRLGNEGKGNCRESPSHVNKKDKKNTITQIDKKDKTNKKEKKLDYFSFRLTSAYLSKEERKLRKKNSQIQISNDNWGIIVSFLHDCSLKSVRCCNKLLNNFVLQSLQSESLKFLRPQLYNMKAFTGEKLDKRLLNYLTPKFSFNQEDGNKIKTLVFWENEGHIDLKRLVHFKYTISYVKHNHRCCIFCKSKNSYKCNITTLIREGYNKTNDDCIVYICSTCFIETKKNNIL